MSERFSLMTLVDAELHLTVVFDFRFRTQIKPERSHFIESVKTYLVNLEGRRDKSTVGGLIHVLITKQC